MRSSAVFMRVLAVVTAVLAAGVTQQVIVDSPEPVLTKDSRFRVEVVVESRPAGVDTAVDYEMRVRFTNVGKTRGHILADISGGQGTHAVDLLFSVLAGPTESAQPVPLPSAARYRDARVTSLARGESTELRLPLGRCDAAGPLLEIHARYDIRNALKDERIRALQDTEHSTPHVVEKGVRPAVEFVELPVVRIPCSGIPHIAR